MALLQKWMDTLFKSIRAYVPVGIGDEVSIFGRFAEVSHTTGQVVLENVVVVRAETGKECVQFQTVLTRWMNSLYLVNNYRVSFE